MNYTDTQLINLAKNNPTELIRLLNSPNADIHLLTSGAEILGGEASDPELVLPVLKRLLTHFNAIVREGAVLGITTFFSSAAPPNDILDKLKWMAKHDPSPGIKEILESFK